MRRVGAVPAWRRTVLSGGRLLVLLAALAGIFAMHGISDHGTMQHGPTGVHQTVADEVHAVVATVSVALDAPAADLSRAADGPDLPHAMTLCVAILAGAVFLALRRRGPSSYPLTSVLATDAGLLLRSTPAHDPDPPDLHALSIQRC